MSENINLEQLRKEYESQIERATPEEVKQARFLDISPDGEVHIVLTKELITRLKLREWLAAYRAEASHSTGGIRGPQNIKYWWDWRFPLHGLGVALATLGKARALQQDIQGRIIRKAVGNEVRYNSAKYVELIARIQAAFGIETHTTIDRTSIPVWLISYVIFMNDFDGGEYVTSSHAISSKIATKDLDNQGSQFMPEMSMRFVNEIEAILNHAERDPSGFTITLSPKHDPRIIADIDGVSQYVNYLRGGVASNENIDLIRRAGEKGFRIMFEFLGGCMYRTTRRIMDELQIAQVYDWNREAEDPFFQGVGKTHALNPKTQKEEFFDYSCDTTIIDVVKTMHYEKALGNKPVGYAVIMTDPDGDRLVVAEVVDIGKREQLAQLGIDCLPINDEKILVVYMPNQSFLMTLDFHARQLKSTGQWEQHDRFMIKTTLSASMWDEWAKANNVAVVNTPVGFKEIAQVMKKVEKQMREHPGEEAVVYDVYGTAVSVGKNPRLLFGGEESGGMIMGPEEIITSRGGRTAIAMREKSAGEASVIITALAAKLYLEKKTFLDYYLAFLDEYAIRYRFNVRGQVTYYNESEPDPEKLKAAKLEGERIRDLNDIFYLTLALARREGAITIEQARAVLHEVFPQLRFDDLKEIHFVGDGTLLEFNDKSLEVRKSGTDAKTRGAAFGVDRAACETYLNAFMNYPGDITPLYERLLPASYRMGIEKRAKALYMEFLKRGIE